MLNKKTLRLLGVTIVALSAAACGSPESNTTDTAQPSSAVKAEVTAQTLSSGTFSGRSDHITTGQVTLEKTATGYQLNFASDFSLDGAPDPIVAIGNNETYLEANKIGVLKNKTGGQVYTLPVSFTPGQFSEVYVWCEKFSVPLGVATLSSS